MKFTVKKVIIPIYFTGISQIYICIKSASVSVHRAIRRNSENIEPWNIARQIRHTEIKKGNFYSKSTQAVKNTQA